MRRSDTEKESTGIVTRVISDSFQKNYDDGIYNHTVDCAILCRNGNIYQGEKCDGVHGSCAEYLTIN